MDTTTAIIYGPTVEITHIPLKQPTRTKRQRFWSVVGTIVALGVGLAWWVWPVVGFVRAIINP